MIPSRCPLAIVMLLAGLSGPAFAHNARSCTVTGMEGEARYGVNGVWQPLKIVTQLPREARIKTGPKDRVKIACNDGITVTIGVATELDIQDLASPSRSIFFRLVDGVVGLVAPGRGWDRIEVRTPLAIASARSTEWLVETAAGAETAVFVRDGRVAVAPADGTPVDLNADEGVTIGRDGTAGPVKIWGAARIARSVDALGMGWR